MIEFASGNLLRANAEALVNTVNTEGVMGKGIALQFKNAYPAMFKAYEAACRTGEVRLGQVQVYDLGGIVDGPRWIINFPTKGHWRSRSQLQDVAAGLKSLTETVQRLGIKSIAVPPLGCGNGGLSWSMVKPLIEQAFAPLADVRVLVYSPAGAPQSIDMPNRTPVPKMTVSTAVLIALMHRYMKGLMEPFVSLLEVQKLMYFMQEAGQPLSLKYGKGAYGPYAPNLSHLLKRMETHYIVGVGDGSSNPTQPLELLDAGVEDAQTLIASDADTQQRLHRVFELIDGFEDSYGMELLSTMLWVMVQSEETRESPSAAIEAVHAWNDRKKKLLKTSHLEKAWQRLKDKQWDVSSYSIVASRV